MLKCSARPTYKLNFPPIVSYRVFKGKSNAPRDDLEVTVAVLLHLPCTDSIPHVGS